MDENLNPHLEDETEEAVRGAIQWRHAPVEAGAYILVCVEHDASVVEASGNEFPRVEHVGCWVMHGSGRRVPAPVFGDGLLQPGQSCIIRRPGSEWDGLAMLLLRTYFEHADIRNLARDEIVEPTPPGWVRPPTPRHRPLVLGIAMALAHERAVAVHS